MILGFDFYRLRSGPFEGPAIVMPPALPGDTYRDYNNCISKIRKSKKNVLNLMKSFEKV